MRRENQPGGVRAGTRVPHHLTYLVEDLPAAALKWHTILGVGPFLLHPHVPSEEITVGGRSAQVRHVSAFAQHGPSFVELQLIEAFDPPSAFEQYRSLGGQGPHHVCYVVNDVEAESLRLEGAGARCIVRAKGAGVDMAIHDGRSTFGLGIQVQQDNVRFTSFFGRVRAVAYDWDGEQLLREFSL